jgi:hypothetical protein
MKKLSLDLAELRVESFETAGDEGWRGTVRGLAESDCCTISCAGTCGNIPDSNALRARRANGDCPVEDTNDVSGCQPCCG